MAKKAKKANELIPKFTASKTSFLRLLSFYQPQKPPLPL